MSAARRRIALALAALSVVVSRLALRARVPEGYDAVGFVLGVRDYDLGRFQPHFPGYPVYLALARIADAALGDPLLAATVVSALASAATALAAWHITRSHAEERAGWIALGLCAVAALPWLMGGTALSDATATAFATLSFAALLSGRPRSGAVMAALMLGTRLSYWPIALSWVALAWRAEANRRRLLGVAATGAAGLLLWALPQVLLVGPSRLVELGRTHVVGHFTTWGGTIVTRPGWGLRLGAFARDLCYDGLAPGGWALAAAATLALWAAWGARPRRSAAAPWAMVVVPYASWVLLGQNVVEQPRHVLPLVVALAVAGGPLLARRPRVALLVVATVAAGSAPLVWARARSLPAAVQAADHVRARYAPRDVVIFGGRSLRLLRHRAPELVTRERTWLAEVDVELARLDVLPRHVLVTSEVEPDPRRAARLSGGVSFCRDVRLDRAQACLTLREYHLRARVTSP